MANAVLTFALYQGETLLRRETVAQEIVKIGKDPRSHLRIDDSQASRMHAVIEVTNADSITLIDLGNEPGTLVNGARISKCRLVAGDRIQVGGTTLVLELIRPAPEEFAHESRVAQPRTLPISPAAERRDPLAAAPDPLPAARNYNPFGQVRWGSEVLANPRARQVPADALPESYTYALVKSGPDTDPDEVELAGVASVEVMILWGSNVLHVSHLTPPRPFYVGEEQGKNISTDFSIPQEVLGTSRMPVVLGDKDAVHLIIPPNATGYVEISGQARISLEDARSRAQPSADMAGASQLSLPPGSKARIEVNQFVFQVATVNAGKPVPAGVGAGMDWAVATYFGVSLLAHAGLIAAMAFFVPPIGITDDDGVDKDQMRLIMQYLSSASEREREKAEEDASNEPNPDDREGGTGTRADGSEGSMGNPTTKAVNKKFAVKGPKENLDPHIARAAALREISETGMVGMLRTGAAGDPDAPTAPWGRDTSLGTDEVSARGNMWGDEIGDAFGAGGLGLTGIGEGGGGRGEGIGLGNIGTIGRGAGTGSGEGFGSGHGRMKGGHQTKSPKVRYGTSTVSGRLPPEVIQRIVRQNYGRFRMCYEQGLARNPNLEGRVSARFVIGRDGAVSNVANGGSDIPDSGVVQCVVRAYYGLSFPQPEGGIVTVVYPIMFAPG